MLFRKTDKDARPERSRQVLAFYYPWYGTPQVSGHWYHWMRRNGAGFFELTEKGVPRIHAVNYPVLGPYDSNDPWVIRSHVKWAEEVGIDGLICSWWGKGSFADKAFKQLLDILEELDSPIRAAPYFEAIPDENPKKALADLRYLVEEYVGRPSFFKAGAIPVVFFYGRFFTQAPAGVIKKMIRKTRKAAPPLCLIADTDTWGAPIPNDEFDGFHFYNPAERLAAGESGPDIYAHFMKTLPVRNSISCLTVIPGFDNSLVTTQFTRVEREQGKLYENLWQAAIEQEPDWILITSWNEWHEGSEIEPSLEQGRKFLDMTREQIRKFIIDR